MQCGRPGTPHQHLHSLQAIPTLPATAALGTEGSSPVCQHISSVSTFTPDQTDTGTSQIAEIDTASTVWAFELIAIVIHSMGG